MFGKTGNQNSHAKQDRSKVPGESAENRKKKRFFTYGLIAVMLICIGIGSAFLINLGRGVLSSNDQVTVAFDSTGGSNVESQTVPRGGKLGEIASPSREGYIFAGWYYDEAPVNAYIKDDVFSSDKTLYAGWYEPDMTSDRAEYLKDSDSSISFAVRSEVSLTDKNLSQYIEFSNVGIQDGKKLSVKQQDNGYLLYSEDGFTPGFTYTIKILDTGAVSFVKAGEKDVSGSGITSCSFTIYRENENNVTQKEAPILLSSADVSSFTAAGQVPDGATGNAQDNGKSIYRAVLIHKDTAYKAGDLISLGSGTEDTPENQYYKVYKVTADQTGTILELIAPNMDEIYSNYEVYYSGDAAYFEEDTTNAAGTPDTGITQKTAAFATTNTGITAAASEAASTSDSADASAAVNTAELAQTLQTSLRESEGYEQLCTLIANSVKASPTLQDTVSTLDAESQEKFRQLSASALTDLLKNVTVSVSIGKTQDLANTDNGCYGKISFSTGDIGIDLASNVKLTINLTLTEDITATVYGWQKLEDGKLFLNNGAYINNAFTMSFGAEIATDSGTVNITDEIQNLIDSQSSDKTAMIVDSLNKEDLFGEDVDYVEILSQELGERTIDIYKVLSIQFKLDFKVSVGLRAGLDLNFSSSELRKIGMCNVDFSSGQMQTTTMKYYSERMQSEVHFTASLKGQMGIRAGFQASVNFSVFHLNDYLNFGFSAEIGVYEELSGYLRFDYDYTASGSSSNTGMSLAGGLRSETGIYVELAFTWNIFTNDGSVTIAEMKFPILTIGALEFASEFKEGTSAITFNTNSYNVKSSGDANLLALKYVDISGGANGVTVNIKPAASNADYAFYLVKDQSGKGDADDLKYVSMDKDTGMITVSDNAPDRLDFTVVVQYTKSCSLFSSDMELITKEINLTYMKYKVADSTQKYKATFYMPDGSVLEEKEYYVGQIPVAPAENTYESRLVYTKYKVKDWSKPWQEDITALYGDSAYHLDCELNYKKITFYGSVLNSDTGTWQYGVIATVPTLAGDIPVPPSAENMDLEPGFEFDSWSPSLRAADADYSYTAVYRQSADMTWTGFYLDINQRISAGYVKKGTLPEAPDMSMYNNPDRQFVGWWPSLHASSENSEIYIAEFRPYVNVTFNDRDGKTLSGQRILAGTAPEAPQAEAVLAGDEDYYEYHFSHWATADGTKPEKVYADTVYTPVYEKHYLEVTTTFDAGGHTFKDGTGKKEYKGTYADYNFLYLPQVTYTDSGITYTVDYWQSTEPVNGTYIKLNMSSIHTDYKYNLTFTPVFKKGDPVEYTVRFDGGDQAIYLTGHYGDLITADMLTALKKTSTVPNYVYTLRSYGLTLPYRFGSNLGADGQSADYINAVARFELTGVDKTYTFDANGGTFAGGGTVKTVTAPYASDASFSETPAKADDDRYTYQFAGWSTDPDATAGSSYGNFIAISDSTLYAIYTRTLRDYTITFDAGSGYYAGGAASIERTYHFGDTIVPPGDPVRDETVIYRYVFTGWQPTLPSGATVTADRVYTAAYKAIRLDGKMDPAGITVSDGIRSEDISVGSIPGYTYAYDLHYNPTLTITGSGLTVSGTSSEVCVIIGSGAADVTCRDLTLSGAYSGINGVLVTAETASPLTINISGSCVFRNTQNGEPGGRFERPVLLQGSGTGAALTISAKGFYGTVYCGSTLQTDSLDLEISAQKRDGDSGYDVTPISNDGASGAWIFRNSGIRFISEGIACEIMSTIRLENSRFTTIGDDGANIMGDLEVAGSSAVSLIAIGENATALCTDTLLFDDFTGSFTAQSTNAILPGIAVRTSYGILFLENGTEVDAGGYDLGGAEIGTFFDDAVSIDYTSFGIRADGVLVPASSVTVGP